MTTPHLFPAIDIREGKAVRLIQGDYGREVDFEVSPVAAAKRWERDGARWLHVVDLDGARSGVSANLADIEKLVDAVGIPVQMGGGLRSEEAVAAVLDAGVERVVLGTSAVRNPDFVDRMVARHGDRIVVSVDVRGGRVAVDGWTDTTGISAADALVDMESRGVRTIIYTPIEVDGMEEGPRLDELRKAAATTRANLIYASGVGRLEHLRELARLRLANLTGVIVGTALYKKRFSISEADAALHEASRSGKLTAA